MKGIGDSLQWTGAVWAGLLAILYIAMMRSPLMMEAHWIDNYRLGTVYPYVMDITCLLPLAPGLAVWGIGLWLGERRLLLPMAFIVTAAYSLIAFYALAMAAILITKSYRDRYPPPPVRHWGWGPR
ncbi:hypothetical protein ACFSM5_21410 [Lacibacterium aquatile]|uniref:DUF1648 domain-containing protein n=1 Tax=Lacibacterium aquatile TaxID=1168082 RepID=A0ABW5DWV5_9PROT